MVLLETDSSSITARSDEESGTATDVPIEIEDYLYNQVELEGKEDDYNGDYFYDFGNGLFSKSVDDLVQGF